MLNVCRLFYIKYPQICATVSHKLQGIDYFPENLAIIEEKLRGSICETVSRKFKTPPELLVTRLSFSHIKKIMPIEDPIERFFYELECIKGTWNVRELRRQIGRGENDEGPKAAHQQSFSRRNCPVQNLA